MPSLTSSTLSPLDVVLKALSPGWREELESLQEEHSASARARFGDPPKTKAKVVATRDDATSLRLACRVAREVDAARSPRLAFRPSSSLLPPANRGPAAFSVVTILQQRVRASKPTLSTI